MNKDPDSKTKADRERERRQANIAAACVLFPFLGFIGGGLMLAAWTSDEEPADLATAVEQETTSAPIASPVARETLADHTLADYAQLDGDRRADLVATQIGIVEAPTADRQAFLDCMGNHAVFKDGDLSAADVFGWCNADRQQNPDRFAAFFNELTAQDLRGEAITMCKDRIRSRLRAPHTASFPWLPDSVRYLGAHRYVINSSVEAEDVTGRTGRLTTTCDAQFHGGDDPVALSAWTFHDLSMR